MESDNMYRSGTKSNANTSGVTRRIGTSPGRVSVVNRHHGTPEQNESVQGLCIRLQREYLAEARKLQRLMARLKKIQAAKRDKHAAFLYAKALVEEARVADLKAAEVREQGVTLGRDLAAQACAKEDDRMMAFDEFLRELQLLADEGNRQTAESARRKEEDRLRRREAAAQAEEAGRRCAAWARRAQEKHDAEKRWFQASLEQKAKEDKARKDKEEEKRAASARQMKERGKSAYVLHVEMLRKEENVAIYMGYMEQQRKLKEMMQK